MRLRLASHRGSFFPRRRWDVSLVQSRNSLIFAADVTHCLFDSGAQPRRHDEGRRRESVSGALERATPDSFREHTPDSPSGVRGGPGAYRNKVPHALFDKRKIPRSPPTD